MATTGATTVDGQDPAEAFELCDRCGIRARIRVVLANGGNLNFCSHHASDLSDALEHAGASVDPIAL